MNFTTRLHTSTTGLALLVLAFLGAACSDGGAGAVATAGDGGAGSGDGGAGGDALPATTPTIQSTSPANGAVDVPINMSAGATFSEPMDRASLDGSTFTVTLAGAPVAGTVIASGATATFWPAARLTAGATYTATITTGAKSAAGVALASMTTWSFTTGTSVAPGTGVNLGSASHFVILAKAGISTVPDSTITGDIGVSPAAATYITGFSLALDGSKVFASTPQVTGKVFAADYKTPTPANLTAAVLDMETAFTDAAARAPDVTELGAGDIGGKTLVPGVYKWGTGLLIPTNVTLAGSSTDVWIFQVAKNLTISSAVRVGLSGGAVASHVFWQVSGLVDMDTTSHCEGTILSKTAITLKSGATVNGRLMAQTAVTLAGSTVTAP